MRRVVLLICLLSCVGVACAKKKTPVSPIGSPSGPGRGGESPLPTPGGTGGSTGASGSGSSTTPGSFGPIYFEYDAAALSPEAMETLKRLGDYLDENPAAYVLIMGHADERGTEEYNLALGEERARVARDFLARYGIDPERIRLLSYGEERPAVVGEDEGSMAQNRRDEFELSTFTAQR